MDEKKIKHKIHVIVTMFWDRSMIFYFLISVLLSNTKYKAYTPKLQQYVIARG